MTDSARLTKLEERVLKDEKAINEIRQFQGAICRMFCAYLAGDDRAIKELLVIASEGGIVKYNTDWTRQKGGSESLVKLQIELNKHYRSNQILVDLQDRISGVCHVSPEVRVETKPGGVVPARPSAPLPWKKQEEGPTLG